MRTFLALMLGMLAAQPALSAVSLAVSCGAVGTEAQLCREGAETWARETGNRVTMVSTPSGSTERLALYQQLLAARSGDIDVLQIDVVWPGVLAAHLLDLSDRLDAPARAAQFPANLENNTVDGRLVAMPWFTNAGVLYYRRDLLEAHGLPVPDTWQALATTARRVMEAERAVFQSGNAVFMRNWPYAWPLMNAADSAVRGRVGVARLPRGDGEDARRSSTLGGEQLAVSRYSRHPAEAAALVMYLTSRAEQKRRAIVAALNPTIRDLYDDPDVLAANPFFATLRESFESAVARPSSVTGGRYNQVSAQFWNAVHAVLSERGTPPDVLARLDRSLARLRRGGSW
jgi:ABC-type glycerol-3-phosphate transport system substrate-binding protein